MGNHDVYDTPEDRAQEVKEKEFQEKVRKLHQKLLETRVSLFTVSELSRLMNMPHRIHSLHCPSYDSNDLLYLRELRNKVEKRTMGQWDKYIGL